MDASPTDSPADGLSEASAALQGGPSRAETARWLYGFVRPQLARLALVLALSLAASLLALAQPWITKLVIDDGLLAGDLAFVAAMCGLMFAAALAGAGLGALNRWHYVTASGRILFALKAAVYRHLQTLSPAYYVRIRGGDLMARLDGDVAEVQRFCVDSALALVNGVIVLVGALALMVGLSPLLSLFAFALLPVQVLVLRVFRPRIERRTRQLRERASGISSFLFDTLSAMKFVQSVAAESREAERLDGLQQVYLGDLLRLQMLNQGAVALPSLLTLVGTVVVFLAGGAMVIDGSMSLGALVAFTAYLARATGPVHTLFGLWVALKRAEVSLARVREITERRPDVVPPADPLALAEDMRGEISFHGVTFSFGADEPPVLEGLDATFPAGARIVVAGASGAGKTTLIDLLQRHYDPDTGTIALDGTDLRRLDVAALRRKVAVVAQDTVLMPGTVADNIRYAAPEADADQVAAAARAAGADGFIAALPGGYDCEVGARGLRLSGGQRQRIAIARAVLQDPLVLILDEATSGVDTETERAIAAAVDRLFGDRTRLVIGHRSTLAGDADVTYRLASGRLVAEPAGEPM